MLRKLINLTVSQTRNYAVVRDVNSIWVKPVTPSCISVERSGDLQKAPSVSPNEVLPEIKSLPEFQQANDMVKTLFTVGHLGKRYSYKLMERELVDKVRRHEFDENSMEVRIAMMTAKIRYHQSDITEAIPRNRERKVALKELIERRNRFLKLMRKWDYKRYEWLLETLSIQFKFLPMDHKRISRKFSLTKLAEIQAEEIKSEKMKEYKEVLIVERENLLKEYEENPLQ